MNSSSRHFWEHFKTSQNLIESHVQEGDGTYKDLAYEALYTSFEDLKHIFSNHHLSGTFCDLGCGTGQAAIFYGTMFKDRKAIGIEFQESRIKFGIEYVNSHGLTNVVLLHDDLFTRSLPDADFYLLYFPTGKVLDRILDELYLSKRAFHLVVIESHGNLIPRIQLENWLQLIDEIKLESTRHYDKAQVFRRLNVERSANLPLLHYSYRPYVLKIDSGDEVWLGDSLGMEWTCDDRYELQTPPRTIYWHQVREVLSESSLEKEIQYLLHLRRSGEVSVRANGQIFTGFIRKIIILPLIKVEFSSGEKVEWLSIRTIFQGNHLCYDSSFGFSCSLPVQLES